MTSFDDLLSQVPVSQIATKLGVDEATANTAIAAAIPVLLGGLQAKASNPEAAGAIEGEIAKQPDDLLDGGVDIEQVDVDGGHQIVDQTFGTEKSTVISALGDVGGAGNDLMGKLMPMLAPIVLAYIGKKMLGGGAVADAGATTQATGGGLGDILGGLLGGATQGGNAAGGLGGVLGDALGKNAGGVLGNVLGGLLGGKK
ncbi:DUF937 domain-containing protein [Nocardia uniformis]|uniref:DUF937 domain-containing protein n=1 Tax=Nocardia uniformis TaxID=53432 RepID=A0A849CDX3_9NOCA|nr:DUF937 domain-containing protein [Nocardia uniformis]NNH76088.1 DUF937 domain-containing protein [Nocardia uniformis]